MKINSTQAQQIMKNDDNQIQMQIISTTNKYEEGKIRAKNDEMAVISSKSSYVDTARED